jgi:hypothetical protein
MYADNICPELKRRVRRVSNFILVYFMISINDLVVGSPSRRSLGGRTPRLRFWRRPVWVANTFYWLQKTPVWLWRPPFNSCTGDLLARTLAKLKVPKNGEYQRKKKVLPFIQSSFFDVSFSSRLPLDFRKDDNQGFRQTRLRAKIGAWFSD